MPNGNPNQTHADMHGIMERIELMYIAVVLSRASAIFAHTNKAMLPNVIMLNMIIASGPVWQVSRAKSSSTRSVQVSIHS